jgi:hypothetical protein
MAPSPLLAFYLATLTTLTLLPLVYAQSSDKKISGQCPDGIGNRMIYSPFKPYFKFDMFSNDTQKCEIVPDCLFEAAGESRKQLFATTALVMGVIPLAIKDIVSPARRLILVTRQLHWIVEILVLAFGLVPIETGLASITRCKSIERHSIAKVCWRLKKVTIILCIIGGTIIMVGAFAGLAWMEIYSKRSVLGCSYPVFIATWFAAGLIPASIHSLFGRITRRRTELKMHRIRMNNPDAGIDPDLMKEAISYVQGADEEWPVQIAWIAYYVSGTQIFTSIVAVTLVELVCWAGLAFFITGCQKQLGLFLCLLWENTGPDSEEEEEL